MMDLKRLVDVKKTQNCQKPMCTREVFDEAETGVDTTVGIMHLRCAVEWYIEQSRNEPPQDVIEWSEPIPQNDALVLCKYDRDKVMKYADEVRPGQSWQVAKL